MADDRSADTIVEQIRDYFQGYKFIIVFIDRRRFPEEADKLRNYFVERHSDSFLMAGHIGDLTNDDRSDDRWKKFSREQYDRLYASFSVKEEPDLPVTLIVSENGETAQISCEANAEEIWTVTKLAYKNKIGKKGPYYLVERYGSVLYDVLLNPQLLKFGLVAPIIVAILLVSVAIITPPIGYILYFAIFIMIALLSTYISKNKDRIAFSDWTFEDVGLLLCVAMPGVSCIMYDRKRGSIIMFAYCLYLLVTIVTGSGYLEFIPRTWSHQAWLAWMLFLPILFQYISLTEWLYRSMEKRRFILSNTVTDYAIKLHFLPMAAYVLVVGITLAIMDVDGIIPILFFSVPFIYFLYAWIRHPMKHAFFDDDMFMDCERTEQ